jgi:hypothetical protein
MFFFAARHTNVSQPVCPENPASVPADAAPTHEMPAAARFTEWQLDAPAEQVAPQPAIPRAAEQADGLAALLRRRESSMQPIVEARLRILEDALESDPAYTPEQMVYLRNRLCNCRLLNEVEEWGAAEYQMREMAHKLRRWDGGDDDRAPATLLDPEPLLPAAVGLPQPGTESAGDDENDPI